jgi:chromosome segregation ATPase
VKVSRIALEEFRKFRQPLLLDGLQDGLNLFVGPNEAGKSTVAAAIRAAFLERYSTSKVADLAPHGESGARPSVELAFTHADHSYVLRKQFLSKARCELVIDEGAQRLDGEEAENALAELLGFELSGRGQSKPDLAGVPGLLWIRQGDGQNLHEAAGYAGAHLRDALTQLSGELASGDGDRLFDRVSAERAALLDARNGRPKGSYKEAEDALARAMTECDECGQAMAQLNADVDRLAELRREHERAQVAQPWKDFEAKAVQARARLAALAKEREAFDGLQREQAQAAQTLALLQDQVRRDQQDESDYQALLRDARAAHAHVQAMQEPLARAQQQRQSHAAAVEAARRRVAQLQVLADRRDLERQLAQLSPEIERLDGALIAVTHLIEQGSALKTEAVRLEISDAEIEALRKAGHELGNLQLQQQAVATRLRYQLDAGAQALLDGNAVSGTGEVLLTAAAELTLPGVGRLQIEPGGQDLPALQRDLARAESACAALLKRADVETLAEAEQRHARYTALQRELDGMRKTLSIHAPRGVDALRTQRDEALARLAQLQERLSKLPPAPSSEAGGSTGAADTDDDGLPDAVQALREAEAVAVQAEKAVADAQRALDADTARAQLLEGQAAAWRVPAGWQKCAAPMTSSNCACVRRGPPWPSIGRNSLNRTSNASRNPLPSNVTRSTSGTATSCNCRASSTKPARRDWANACPKRRPPANACNGAAMNSRGAPPHWTCCRNCWPTSAPRPHSACRRLLPAGSITIWRCSFRTPRCAWTRRCFPRRCAAAAAKTCSMRSASARANSLASWRALPTQTCCKRLAGLPCCCWTTRSCTPTTHGATS